MSSLRIISEEIPSTVLELSPGQFSIGRTEDNDFQINHLTVSSHHCHIIVSGGRVIVKDLGSTNGTFIDENPILEDAVLQPGQVLRLGDIRLRHEAPVRARIHVAVAAGDVAAAEEEAPSPHSVQHPCYKHPQTEGEWICPRCHEFLCSQCSPARKIGEKTTHRCPLCASKALSVAEHEAELARLEARSSMTLKQRLLSAFAYPFAKGGVLFLIMGTIVFWLVDLFKMIIRVVPLLGIAALVILLIFSWGWLFAYVQKIVVSCSNDEDVLPDWPEIASFGEDLVQPFLSLLGTLALCFGPAVLYSYFAGSYDFAPFLFYPLFLLGIIYLPMALLVVSLTSSAKSANPFVVLPAILKIPKDYAWVCLFFILGLGVWNGSWLLVKEFAPEIHRGVDLLNAALWHLGWSLPLDFLFLYCLVVCVRVLGMMYRRNWRTLGWFRH